MYHKLPAIGTLVLLGSMLSIVRAADPPDGGGQAAPAAKLKLGDNHFPQPDVRGYRGELVRMDPATRTAVFRSDETDEVQTFQIAPFALIFADGARGRLEDFRVGQRLILSLFQNERGEWLSTRLVSDELTSLHAHADYYHVKAIDPEKRTFTCTWQCARNGIVRGENEVVHTDEITKFWRDDKEVKFEDVRVGDKFTPQTHGTGKGRVLVAWDVHLDDERIKRIKAEQAEAHQQRIETEGMPGTIVGIEGADLQVILFSEADRANFMLRAQSQVRIARAGADLRANGPAASAVTTLGPKLAFHCWRSAYRLDSADHQFKPDDLVRIWVEKK